MQRLRSIDFLRGLAILAMIVIHTNAYFRSDPLAFALWNYNEWAVAAFLFCSFYIFFSRNHQFGWRDFLAHIQKRVWRLLAPYYYFLIPFLLLVTFFQPKQVTANFVLQSIFIIGGVDINWLILLFILLTIIITPIIWLKHHKKSLFYTYVLLAIISAFIFLNYSPPFSNRYINWLPWSLVPLASLYTIEHEKKKWFFPTAIIGLFILFLGFQQVQISHHHSLNQYDNKYPPNAFHLSYALFGTYLFYFIFREDWLDFFPINKSLHFLSRYSYSLFFIHWTVIYVLSQFHWEFNWWIFLLLVLTITIIIQMGINKIVYHITPKLESAPIT